MMLESIEKLREQVRRVANNSLIAEITVDVMESWCDEIQAEVESKYMLLPVDVDGVSIHVGDVMIDNETPRTVVAVTSREVVLTGYRFDIASNYKHYEPRTVEDVMAEYAELSAKQDVKDYLDVSKKLREIQQKQFSDEPALELYKEFGGYEFYIELPYDELWITTDKAEVKHHRYSYRYKRPDGSVVMSCSSLCKHSREWAVKKLDECIGEVELELKMRDAE